MPKKTKKATFEKNLTQLENIVETLEDGGSSLEESLTLFEKGIKISNECHHDLLNAENKVEILLKEDDKIEGREPFED